MGLKHVPRGTVTPRGNRKKPKSLAMRGAAEGAEDARVGERFQLVLIGWHDLTVDPRRISGRHLKYALFQPILSMPICVIGRPTRFLDQGIVSHDLPGNSVGRSRLWIRVLSHIPQRHPRAKQSPQGRGGWVQKTYLYISPYSVALRNE